MDRELERLYRVLDKAQQIGDLAAADIVLGRIKARIDTLVRVAVPR